MLTAILAFQSTTSQSDYIKNNTHPITLSQSNFEKIGQAIGEARIVQLGELTHGDGTSFQFKVEIIKYLHQKKEFSVLVWESGLADCLPLNKALTSQIPIHQAASNSVFTHWSMSKEAIEIFKYARKTASKTNPLLMAGYDIQPSSPQGFQHINVIAHSIKNATPKALHPPFLNQVDNQSNMDDQATLALAPKLHQFLVKNQKTLTEALGRTQYQEYNQLLYSAIQYNQMMKSYTRYQSSQTAEEFAIGYNIRERANANNFNWLADSKYKDRKIIIWAHNSHISNFGSSGTYNSESKDTTQLDSTGRLLKNKFKNNIYTIGFVAHSGSWSWLGQPEIPFTLGPKNSLESQINSLKHNFAFTDLSKAEQTPTDPINSPIPGYLNRQNGQISNLIWPNVFDGIIFIKKMRPRTQITPSNPQN